MFNFIFLKKVIKYQMSYLKTGVLESTSYKVKDWLIVPVLKNPNMITVEVKTIWKCRFYYKSYVVLSHLLPHFPFSAEQADRLIDAAHQSILYMELFKVSFTLCTPWYRSTKCTIYNSWLIEKMMMVVKELSKLNK